MRSIPWQKVMGGGALSRRLARIHLYLRGRTKVCWQHGRHVSELFHSPLCAFIVWQGRPLFYSRRFQRRWEPPTCNLSREAIFEEKRGMRVATPAIMGMLANSPRYTPASRNFTRLPPFFFPRATETLWYSFQTFPYDLRGNAFFSGRKDLLRSTISLRANLYFYYEIVGKELILQLFEKSCVGVS